MSQIDEDGENQVEARSSRRRRAAPGNEDESDDFIPGALSRKILMQAREQQKEEEGVTESKEATGFDFGDFSDEDDMFNEDEMVKRDGEYIEEVEINENDERALQMFLSGAAPERRTLADIIMEKIQEKVVLLF